MNSRGFDFNSDSPSSGNGAPNSHASTHSIGGSDPISLNTVVTLTDSATISTNASSGNVFIVTLGGNRILGAPTNPSNGQKVIWRFKQDGTGNRTISFDSIFRIALSLDTIVLSTTPGTQDYLGAIYNGTDSKWDIIAFAKGIS